MRVPFLLIHGKISFLEWPEFEYGGLKNGLSCSSVEFTWISRPGGCPATQVATRRQAPADGHWIYGIRCYDGSTGERESSLAYGNNLSVTRVWVGVTAWRTTFPALSFREALRCVSCPSSIIADSCAASGRTGLTIIIVNALGVLAASTDVCGQ